MRTIGEVVRRAVEIWGTGRIAEARRRSDGLVYVRLVGSPASHWLTAWGAPDCHDDCKALATERERRQAETDERDRLVWEAIQRGRGRA